jgi:hypothetical protein
VQWNFNCSKYRRSDREHPRKEFLAEFTVVYKESRETLLWLKFMKESNILNRELSDSLIKD